MFIRSEITKKRKRKGFTIEIVILGFATRRKEKGDEQINRFNGPSQFNYEVQILYYSLLSYWSN